MNELTLAINTISIASDSQIPEAPPVQEQPSASVSTSATTTSNASISIHTEAAELLQLPLDVCHLIAQYAVDPRAILWPIRFRIERLNRENRRLFLLFAEKIKSLNLSWLHPDTWTQVHTHNLFASFPHLYSCNLLRTEFTNKALRGLAVSPMKALMLGTPPECRMGEKEEIADYGLKDLFQRKNDFEHLFFIGSTALSPQCLSICTKCDNLKTLCFRPFLHHTTRPEDIPTAKELPEIMTLSLYGISQGCLEKCSGLGKTLRALSLKGTFSNADILSLPHLDGLIHLDLSFPDLQLPEVNPISKLATYEDLQTLILENYPLQNGEGLGKFKNLKSLSICLSSNCDFSSILAALPPTLRVLQIGTRLSLPQLFLLYDFLKEKPPLRFAFINFASDPPPPDIMDIGNSKIIFSGEKRDALLQHHFPLYSSKDLFENIQEYQASL
jgi:hypothetical protein